MATTKSKKTTSKKSSTSKSTKATETKTVSAKAIVSSEVDAKKNPLKGFFGRKYDADESILSIFKSPKIYGALLGELIGVMLLTMLFQTLGLYQPLYALFIVVGVTVAMYGLSGANLNPIITVGMMATRRMSVIRGVLYIIAQILGAWIATLILGAFISAGDDIAELSSIEIADSSMFWAVTMIEFLAAIVFAFFFARALNYRHSVFTFGAVVGVGFCLAVIFAIVISGNFLGLSNNFAVNPAMALMMNILPNGGENFGEIFGNICSALTTYALFPMIGGVVGFYLSDFTGRISGEFAKVEAKIAAKKK